MKNYLTTNFKSAMTTLCLLVLFGIGSNSLWGQSLKIELSSSSAGTATPPVGVTAPNVQGGSVTDLCDNSCHIVTLIPEYCNASGVPTPLASGQFEWTLPDGSTFISNVASGEIEIPISALSQAGNYTLSTPNFNAPSVTTNLVISESVTFQCPPRIDVTVTTTGTCSATLNYDFDVTAVNCGSYNWAASITLEGATAPISPSGGASGTFSTAAPINISHSFGSGTSIGYGTHDLLFTVSPASPPANCVTPTISCNPTIYVIDGATNIACNDQLNVTLDAECEATITPETILEGDFCFTSFILEVDLDGDGIIEEDALDPNSELDETGSIIRLTAPGTYTVSVENPLTGVSCWGTINAEDKTIPQIDCGDNTTNPIIVKCSVADDISPGTRIRDQKCFEPVETDDNDSMNGDGAADGDDKDISTIPAPLPGDADGVVCVDYDMDLSGMTATGAEGTIVDIELDFIADVPALTDFTIELISPDGDMIPVSSTSNVLDRDTITVADFCGSACDNGNIKAYFSDDAMTTINNMVCQSGDYAALGPFKPSMAFSAFAGYELGYDSDDNPDNGDDNLRDTWTVRVCNKGGNDILLDSLKLTITFDKGPLLGGADLAGNTTGCGGNIVYIPSDDIVVQDCTDEFYEIIERTWTVLNEDSGFSNSCTQIINVERWTLDELEFPPNYDGITYPALTCEDLFGSDGELSMNNVNLRDTVPLPSLTGRPTVPFGDFCGNFQATYTDTKINLCGAFDAKIIREWKVLDWCDSKIATGTQIIKISNNSQIIMSCAPNQDEAVIMTAADGSTFPAFASQTDNGTCSGDWPVPQPSLLFSSCGVNIESVVVEFKIADEMGQAPIGTDFASFDAETGARVITDSDGVATMIQGLPGGLSWVRYTATDECGNTQNCTVEVFMADGTLPNPVCIEHIVVSVGANGCGTVPALSIDNNSYDNCGSIVKWEVKKDNESDFSYGPTIEYCCGCSDPIQFANLRVTDADGNSNSCTVEIELQNNFVPTVNSSSLPTSFLSYECNNGAVDLHAIATDGLALFDVSSGCPTFNDMFSVTARYANGPNAGQIVNPGDELIPEGCGSTSVTIKYEVVDECGNTLPINGRTSYDQTIEIGYNTSSAALMINRTLPDITLFGCESNPLPSNLNSNQSLSLNDISSSGCSSEIAITYNDLVFNDVEGHCMQIIRTWTVIDWCIVNNNGGSIPTGTLTTSQTINIDDNDAPDITNQSDVTKPASKSSCEILLQQSDLTFVVSDLCTATEDITITYKVNGIVTNNILNRNYDSGTAFTICATDLCGNTESLQFFLYGIDDVAPTPYCRDQVVTTINSNGFAEIWTSDFDLGSTDNCDSQLDVYFENGQTFTRFFCEDIANGISQIINLEMFYRDDAGNVNSCLVSIFVQDNDDHCPNIGGGSRIQGNIHTEEEQMVTDVSVNLMNSEGPMMNSMTPVSGTYAFDNTPDNKDYIIVPHKDDSYLNGVSTLDLVMIQRHILGINRFDSAYKAIAADTDNSGNIDGIDLVTLRKLILGIITELPHGQQPWRFPIEKQTFANVNKPFPFLEEINVYNLSEDMNDQNFVGVKVGDINGDAIYGLRSGDEDVDGRSSSKLTLEVDDMGIMEGSMAQVPVRATNMEDIVGFQTTLTFNPDVMEFVGVTAEGLDLDETNLGLQNLADGYITVSWNNLNGVTVADNRTLFNLEFKINESANLSEQLFLSSALTSSEAYTGEMETIKLNLEYKGADLSDFVLYQNIPNPFTDNTEIRFNLPAAADVSFSVFDVTGRAIFNKTSNYEGGSHTITLTNTDLSSTGILYYKLETPYGTASRKMIQVR